MPTLKYTYIHYIHRQRQGECNAYEGECLAFILFLAQIPKTHYYFLDLVVPVHALLAFSNWSSSCHSWHSKKKENIIQDNNGRMKRGNLPQTRSSEGFRERGSVWRNENMWGERL